MNVANWCSRLTHRHLCRFGCVRMAVALPRSRVITNRRRDGDGGDHAGEQLLAWIRDSDESKRAKWNKMACLLFCGNPAPVEHLHKPKENLLVSNKATEVIAFCDPKHKLSATWKSLKSVIKLLQWACRNIRSSGCPTKSSADLLCTSSRGSFAFLGPACKTSPRL